MGNLAQVLPAANGFSHGAAGVAWALLRLAARTCDPRYRAAALEGMSTSAASSRPRPVTGPTCARPATRTTRPRSLGRSSRPPGATARRASGWPAAHAGVLDDPEVRAEIDAAIETTLAFGHGSSHALCHGSLGNLELLLQAGEHLGSDRWRREGLWCGRRDPRAAER